MRYYVLALALLCAGCARVVDGKEVISANLESLEIYDVGGYIVRDFRLTDGTRCVTMSSGGIDCDWSSGGGK